MVPRAHGASGKLLVRVPLGAEVPVVTLLAAASLVAGATGPTFAATVPSERLDGGGSRLVMAVREQELKFSLAEAMAELKRAGGLTWDQLGRVFNVTRRTVHTWAKDGPIGAGHLEKVQALLARVRSLAGYRPFEVRSFVLGEAELLPSLVATGEPPILVSDPTPFEHKLEVARTSSMKVVRA